MYIFVEVLIVLTFRDSGLAPRNFLKHRLVEVQSDWLKSPDYHFKDQTKTRRKSGLQVVGRGTVTLTYVSAQQRADGYVRSSIVVSALNWPGMFGLQPRIKIKNSIGSRINVFSQTAVAHKHFFAKSTPAVFV